MSKAKELARQHRMLSVDEVELLQELADGLPEKPVIVNIGAGVGTSAAAFFEARPDALLFTVDKDKSRLELEDRTLRQLGLYPAKSKSEFRSGYYFQVLRDSIKAAGEWGSANKPARNIDLLFVDGNHDAGYLEREITAWMPNVKSGGIIAFHDFSETHPRAKVEKVMQGVYEVVTAWASKTAGIHQIGRARFLAAYRIA